MNRQEFGQLLATLRQDLGWTQFQLAEYSDIDEAIISQMERGVKKFFESDLLISLANAFQLTTLERREFFLAASGVDQRQMMRQPSAAAATDTNHPTRILNYLIETLRSMRLPAFISDVYGDAIAANRAVIDFFHIPEAMIAAANQVPAGYNTIRMTFNRDLIAHSHVLDNWDAYAMATMSSYRAATLRYRAKPYFKYLLKTFRDPIEYPLFDRFWKRVSSLETDNNMDSDRFHYRHENYGEISYLTMRITTHTSFGEVFLLAYLPLDEHTEKIFSHIYQGAGKEIVRLAPWPEKPRL
jgi:transcriptional regulator with XRE-family HTH domain